MGEFFLAHDHRLTHLRHRKSSRLCQETPTDCRSARVEPVRKKKISYLEASMKIVC